MSDKQKLALAGVFNIKECQRNLYKKKAWWQHPPYHNNRKTSNQKEQQQ